MNSIRCSRPTTAVLCVAILLATAGTVSAFAVSSEGVPQASQVGSDVSSVTYTIDDPFTGTANEWTLRGSTGLENVSWTITVVRAGSTVNQTTYGNQSFSHPLRIDGGGDEVVVELAGTTPAVENFTYDPRPAYQVAELSRVTGSNTQTFVDDTAYHYTPPSEEARAAIEDAQAAIESAGGHGGAAELVDSAISAYESEDFENAVDLANRAERKATSAQRNATILMGLGGAIVILALIGGGYYYWQSRGDDYSTL